MSTDKIAKMNGNSAYESAVLKASKVVEPRSPSPKIDPFKIVSNEMGKMAEDIGRMLKLESNHPKLSKVAMYYFGVGGKHVRPLIVLTLSKALAEIPKEKRDRAWARGVGDRDGGVNESITPVSVLNPVTAATRALSGLTGASTSSTDTQTIDGITPQQRRLAEIVEVIHTASLLHDDVIDNSETRRGNPSGNIAFGNKMSILAGDFLLGAASVAIARIRNPEVIELLSTTMANLVEGEFLQLKNSPLDSNSAAFEYYLHKTYLKTASLMSKSCQATAVLASAHDDVIEACYQFGKNLGLCFQIVDDMLDYTVPAQSLGKPAGADLKLGLATAPVLYAWEKYPELGEMIRRQFSKDGDVELAREYVEKAGGLEKTKQLAIKYANNAIKELQILPESNARSALIELTKSLVTRNN